ncbi:unnamed protein product, partial [Notodromas monacha]
LFPPLPLIVNSLTLKSCSYGKPGVEFYGQHKNGEAAVTQIFFLSNQGRLVTLCDDNSLHLWELNEEEDEADGWVLEEIKEVALEGKLKRISACCLERSGDHLLIGTEGGNIYLLDLKSFEMTEQIIYQDVVLQNVPDDYKVNPGAVEAIAEHPTMEDKILIGYNRGLSVLWDKKETQASKTYVSSQQLESLSWNEDGTRFLSSHNDGSYIEWDAEEPSKAGNPTTPFGPFPCKAISRILWKINTEYSEGIYNLSRSNDGTSWFNRGDLKIFSGGMPRASHGDKNTVTLVQKSKTIALDFTSKVVDFLTIPNAAGTAAGSLIVLVEEELIGIDLEDPAWPQLRLPYLAPLHASPVTATHVVSGVSADVMHKIRDAGEKQSEGLSTKEWPVNGGKTIGDIVEEEGTVLVTGHEDGTVRFWDAGRVAMCPLMTFKSAGTMFLSETEDEIVPAGEDNIPSADQDQQDDEMWPMRKIGSFDPFSDDPRLAIKKIFFCPRSGNLVVGGTAGQVVIAQLSEEKIADGKVQVNVVELVADVDGFAWKGHEALKVKSAATNGTMKFEPGLQSVAIVQLQPPACVTALTASTTWGVVAVGTAHGFTLFDRLAKKAVVVKCTLNPHDYAGGAGDAPMSRRKSFKKSLRESFRKLRKGRSAAPEAPANKRRTATRTASEEKESPRKASTSEKEGTETEKPEKLAEVTEENKAEDEKKEQETEGEKTDEKKEPEKDEKVDEEKSGEKQPDEGAKAEEQRGAQADDEAGKAGASTPKKEVVEVGETKPVERQIEARSADDTFTGLIRCLALVDCNLLSLNTKTPTFWVGNNSGAIFIYTLSFPAAEKRSENAVSVRLAKEIQLKHRAPVMSVSVLDGNVPVAEFPSEPEEVIKPVEQSKPAEAATPVASVEESKEVKEEKEKGAETSAETKEETKKEEKKEEKPPAPVVSHSKPASHPAAHPKVLICSEEQFKIFSLPNLKPLGKYKLTAHEGARIKKVHWAKFSAPIPPSSPSKTESTKRHEEMCLMCLSNQGDVSVFTVPDLRRQMLADCVRKEDINGMLSLSFTSNGEALYLQSSSELQRASLAANHAIESKCGVCLLPDMRPKKQAKVESTKTDAEKVDDATHSDKHNQSTGNGDVKNENKEIVTEESKLETSQMSTDITIDSIKDHVGNLETSITKKTEIKTESISEKIEESITMSKITTISSETVKVPIAGSAFPPSFFSSDEHTVVTQNSSVTVLNSETRALNSSRHPIMAPLASMEDTNTVETPGQD